MKIVFIPARIRKEPNYFEMDELINKKIPEKKIALCYSNQFVEVAKRIEKIIDKKVIQKIQILGCSNPKFPKDVDAVLVIGQGKFHPVSLAYESELPTYVLEGEKIKKIKKEEIKKMKDKEKGMYLKYLNSEKVGILITSKPRQQRIKEALEYIKNLKEKKGYLFLTNDIDPREFENFQIDCWINTACPRIDLTDGAILNLEKLKTLQKK